MIGCVYKGILVLLSCLAANGEVERGGNTNTLLFEMRKCGNLTPACQPPLLVLSMMGVLGGPASFPYFFPITYGSDNGERRGASVQEGPRGVK